MIYEKTTVYRFSEVADWKEQVVFGIPEVE